MRGEDEMSPASAKDLSGSPPHAWGRLQLRPHTRISQAVHPHMRGEDSSQRRWWAAPGRFTPTCVGKTQPGQGGTAHPPVHPHMRGEDVYWAGRGGLDTGSPPHAWGRRPDGRGPEENIPVHPHMRGEDDDATAWDDYTPGSPPHAWGRPRYL